MFDNVAKSLAFDEETIKGIVKNLEEIKSLIPGYVADCVAFFPGVDRTVGGWEGLSAAQQAIRDPQKKTDFARNFARLAKVWEIVSPDEALKPHLADYTWLASVYQSVRPVTPGSLIWAILGAKTIEIIHQNIDTIDIGRPLEELVVDADIIDSVIEDEKKREKRIIEVEKLLRLRLGKHPKTGKYKLSHRVLLEKPEGYQERPERRPRPERGERRPRPERGEHQERRPRPERQERHPRHENNQPQQTPQQPEPVKDFSDVLDDFDF